MAEPEPVSGSVCGGHSESKPADAIIEGILQSPGLLNSLELEGVEFAVHSYTQQVVNPQVPAPVSPLNSLG